VRKILRAIVAMLAVAALAGGGTVAFADRGPGDGSGSGGSGEDRHDDQGAGKDDEDDDAQPADVYTLAEPEHGNPEGVALTGRLFRIKVGKDGNDARKIRELKVKGGPFPGGDGLLIDRGRLLVVQGSAAGFPNGVVDVIELRGHSGKARLEDQRTDASFQGPSTIARARDRYLVVNADFATGTPPFTVTALQR
jgi:hypothetical protein